MSCKSIILLENATFGQRIIIRQHMVSSYSVCLFFSRRSCTSYSVPRTESSVLWLMRALACARLRSSRPDFSVTLHS
jgi:hypothetical protein